MCYNKITIFIYSYLIINTRGYERKLFIAKKNKNSCKGKFEKEKNCIIASNEEAIEYMTKRICKGYAKTARKVVKTIFKDALDDYNKNKKYAEIAFNALEDALNFIKRPYSHSALSYWLDWFDEDMSALYNPDTGKYESDFQALCRYIEDILDPTSKYEHFD